MQNTLHRTVERINNCEFLFTSCLFNNRNGIHSQIGKILICHRNDICSLIKESELKASNKKIPLISGFTKY